MTRADAVIVAAGKGQRFGTKMPKQFLTVGGKPMLAWSLQAFEAQPLIHHIVVVGSDDWLVYITSEIVERFRFDKVIKVVSGGEERQDSVFKGVSALEEKPFVVLIHDAARPLVNHRLIEQVIQGIEDADACVPGIPVADTIKQVESQWVEKTLERDRLRLIQTPQAFHKKYLISVLEQAKREQVYVTDEAALVEKFGGRIRCIEGDPHNLKITTQLDLKIAERILEEKGFCE